MPRRARLLTASGMRNAAPSTVRPNTTVEGGMCSTATRMNRNELPQMTDVAPNSSSHRAGRKEVLRERTMPGFPEMIRLCSPGSGTSRS